MTNSKEKTNTNLEASPLSKTEFFELIEKHSELYDEYLRVKELDFTNVRGPDPVPQPIYSWDNPIGFDLAGEAMIDPKFLLEKSYEDII